MLRVEFWPGPHWVTDDEASVIRAVAESTLAEARALLPGLHDDLYLLVNQTKDVLASGDSGFTMGPQVIRWDVDPARGLEAVATAALRPTLLHEAHHAARLTARPGDDALTSWESCAVFEGLASTFQTEVTGCLMPWQSLSDDVADACMHELFAQPVDGSAAHWRFEHPDGRRWIAYQVGSWIAARATARSGRTAAQLVDAAPELVLDLAEVRHPSTP